MTSVSGSLERVARLEAKLTNGRTLQADKSWWRSDAARESRA